MTEIDQYLATLMKYKEEAKKINNEKDIIIFSTLIVYKGLTELLLKKIDELENNINMLNKNKDRLNHD